MWDQVGKDRYGKGKIKFVIVIWKHESLRGVLSMGIVIAVFQIHELKAEVAVSLRDMDLCPVDGLLVYIKTMVLSMKEVGCADQLGSESTGATADVQDRVIHLLVFYAKS